MIDNSMSAYKPSLSLFLSLPLLIINTNTGGELNYNIYDIYGTSSDTDSDTDTDRKRLYYSQSGKRSERKDGVACGGTG